ncbi:MAG TPA: hypothetical protein DCY64_03805 [Hydrogenophaga sp.]|uniref:caspase family protein n=1 Tax=Hydrogenophaga sp. TaxID=1904254 RepID=UPI000E9DB02E|nr:caspase family protein [Hydrogenophaga sp.]HAX19390.1 hypothetical protein [Hydrogenophaga sp.]HBU18711.1 hypothetical protein [Hydrogenophaga sp.]
MKRQAVIICASGNELPGAKADAANMQTFLLSARGGSWAPHEVTVLSDPSSSLVDAHIALASLADYSFVAFGGHGRYNVFQKTTELEIAKNVYIDVNKLRVGAKRHTLIIDTCRVLHKTTLNERLLAKATMDSIQFSENNSRQIFDSQLQDCPPGIIEIYSCDISETAGEEASGGYYTSALLGAAELWGQNAPRSRVLTVKEAHDSATMAVHRKTGNRQNPRVGYPRSQPYFPFAVKGA